MLFWNDLIAASQKLSCVIEGEISFKFITRDLTESTPFDWSLDLSTVKDFSRFDILTLISIVPWWIE